MKLMEVVKRFYQYRDHFEVIYFFRMMDLFLRGCEGEMWEWMEFYHYSPSETLAVLTADQFVGRDDGALE